MENMLPDARARKDYQPWRLGSSTFTHCRVSKLFHLKSKLTAVWVGVLQIPGIAWRNIDLA